jgi:hypothetical protein
MPIANTNEQPDYAAEVVARLKKDYALLFESVSEVLSRLRALPKVIENDAQLDDYAKVIRDARDLNKRIDVYHDMEKAPFLRGGQGCDQVFFAESDKLARRKPNNPAGGIDIADARVDAYMQEKLRIEREAREKIAAEERAKAAAEQAKLDAARKAAEEAAAKAARARNEENIAAHRAEAEKQAAIAAEALKTAELAAQQAEDARIETKASAADMTRTRLDSGAIGTMAQTPLVQIDDITKLDKNLLWPFLKEDAVLSALKAWAKTKNHRTPMEGATIKLINKGQVR